MRNGLTINQIAVMSLCSVVVEAAKQFHTHAYWSVVSTYAPENELQDLIDRGLIIKTIPTNTRIEVMQLTTTGNCHLLNLSKQPVY